jgi:hypothetical protein
MNKFGWWHRSELSYPQTIIFFPLIVLAVSNFYVSVTFKMGNILYATPLFFLCLEALLGEGGAGRDGVGFW